MEVITSKIVKEYILDPTNDLDELFTCMEEEYNATISGIFAALYKLLLRNYDQNKKRIDEIITILDNVVDTLDDNEIKVLNKTIENFDNNIFNNLKKKQQATIRESVNKINEIHNKAANKTKIEFKNNKIKLLHYLIFHEKNLKQIEEHLKDTPNLLRSCNEDGEDILMAVIKNYVHLNEHNIKEINFFYNVILLFIDSKFGEEIFENRSKYTKILKTLDVQCKEHVIKLIELFDKNFNITLEEIEKRYDKKFYFPSIILDEVNTFIMDNEGRVNFTNQDCITIDGKDSLCLDDALYLEKNQDGMHTLYIHIADVPSFIPYNSITNNEASKRIETIYLNGSKICLYPEVISDRLCSLLPNNNRNVITSIYKLDEKCHLISDTPTIVKGKIKTKYKLTYDEADKIINNLTSNDLDKMLGKLLMFSLNQQKQNPEREMYRNLENFILFETHHESLKLSYSPSTNIVHESMVLNNHGLAKYFKDIGLPYMYRYLQVPSDTFINEQVEKIKSLDGVLSNQKKLMRILIENYTRAEYTTEPLIHQGHKTIYSHSSSPLRRYADSYCQYLIYDFLFKENLSDLNIARWEYKTKELAKQINKTKQENEDFARHYNYLVRKKLIKK